MHRNLSAVLAADVVEYSRLMGKDAEGTLSALRRLRAELFGPAVAGHRGKLVKSMGDGWLVTFDSAANAVECAMQLQDNLAEDQLIQLRIGVHLGDVVHEDEDVFGDGVNVAARLQEIAEPGAVVISDAVYGSLDGTLRPSFDDQGEPALKNISQVIRVWTRGGEIAGGSAARTNIAGFPRLSIVPLETSDERAEVRELADALTNDLLTYLGTAHWMTATILSQPDHGAYVLKGVLRVRANQLRLETTLTAPDGTRLWSEKYGGDLLDAFDWQDTTSLDLATRSYGLILDHEALSLSSIPEAEMTAEQWCLQGLSRLSYDAAGLRRFFDCMDRAINLSPDWGYAYSISIALVFGAVSTGMAQQIAPYVAKQHDWMAKAAALEPEASPVRVILAFAQLIQTGDRDMVRPQMTALLRHLPFDPDILIFGGWLFLYAGEPQAALDCLRKAARIAMHTPHATGIRNGFAFANVQLGNYEIAVEEAKAATKLNPDYSAPYRMRAAAFAQLGRMQEAADTLTALERLVPGDTISALRARSGYPDAPDAPGIQRYLEGLRLAGMPE